MVVWDPEFTKEIKRLIAEEQKKRGSETEEGRKIIQAVEDFLATVESGG
jgi:hypothetical protein